MFTSSPAFAGTDVQMKTTNKAGAGSFYSSGSSSDVEVVQVCDEKAGDGLYPVVQLKYGNKETSVPDVGDNPDCDGLKLDIAEGTSVQVRIYLSRPGSDTRKYYASSWYTGKA